MFVCRRLETPLALLILIRNKGSCALSGKMLLVENDKIYAFVKILGSCALSGKMLLVRIVENN